MLQVQGYLAVIVLIAYQTGSHIHLSPLLGGTVVECVKVIDRIAGILIALPLAYVAVSFQAVLEQPLGFRGLVLGQHGSTGDCLEAVGCGSIRPVQRCGSALAGQRSVSRTCLGFVNAMGNRIA